MIFLGRKANQLEKLQTSLENQLNSIQKDLNGIQLSTDHLKEEVRLNGGEIQKHNMSLEDALDTIQEQAEKETCQEVRIKELEAVEKALLELVMAYQQQMHMISEHMGQSGNDDMAWNRQISIVQEEITHRMAACGMSEITGAGEKVNYDYHEVIGIADTENAAQVLEISRVHVPGCIYKGKIRQKAKVTAYRLKQEQVDGIQERQD